MDYKKKHFMLAVFLPLVILFGVGAGMSYSYNHWDVIAQNFLSVGSTAARTAKARVYGSSASEYTLQVRGYAAQSSNLLQVENSSGTAEFTVTPAGIATTTSNLISGGFIKAASKTADPCAAGLPGYMFWNGTSQYMCVCGGSHNGTAGAVDMKIDGSSAACF